MFNVRNHPERLVQSLRNLKKQVNCPRTWGVQGGGVVSTPALLASPFPIMSNFLICKIRAIIAMVDTVIVSTGNPCIIWHFYNAVSL